MIENKIKLIIAFPSRRRYRYYINDNLNDMHAMDKNDFYLFAASLLKPPTTTILNKFIKKNKNFIVDVDANEVSELKPDSKDKEKKRQDFRKANTKKALQESKKRERKDNSLYQSDNEKLLKGLGL